MELSGALNAFIAHRELKGVSGDTIALYQRWLGHWCEWRDNRDLTHELSQMEIDEFRLYIRYLAEEHIPHGENSHRPSTDRRGLAPATVETAWRILRAFWRFCDGEEWLTSKQARFFARDRIPRPKVPEQARPAADVSLLGKLLGAIATAPIDQETKARDRVIVRLLFESGLRVSELCHLTDSAISLTDRSAKIVGKGGRFRHVFWEEETSQAMREYLRLRRGPIGDGTFIRGTSHRNDGGQMTRDAIRAQLKRHAERVGLMLPRSAPVHCFRHGFVHAGLDAGVPIDEVSQLAGHASIQTTMIYARRNKERLKQAHSKIFRRKNDPADRKKQGNE